LPNAGWGEGSRWEIIKGKGGEELEPTEREAKYIRKWEWNEEPKRAKNVKPWSNEGRVTGGLTLLKPT